MAQKWFVQADDNIHGPFSSEDIQTRLQTGQLAAHHLIWGAGMDQWRNLNWWARESHTVSAQPTAAATPAAQEVWHFASGGQSRGPFNRENLLHELKKLEALSDVLLWTKGMKEWAPIFEFHDVLSAVGVNKRVFPRADIEGQVVIKTEAGTITAPLLTISEGGLGAVLDGGVTPGAVVQIEIHSGVFRSPVTAKAEVRYLADNVCGLRFSSLSNEAKGAIVSFVRQSQTRFVLRAS